MSRSPGPAVQPPAGTRLVSYDELREGTACPDCASTPMFVPMRFPGSDATVFGIYVAHDNTCPQMNQPEEQHG